MASDKQATATNERVSLFTEQEEVILVHSFACLMDGTDNIDIQRLALFVGTDDIESLRHAWDNLQDKMEKKHLELVDEQAALNTWSPVKSKGRKRMAQDSDDDGDDDDEDMNEEESTPTKPRPLRKKARCSSRKAAAGITSPTQAGSSKTNLAMSYNSQPNTASSSNSSTSKGTETTGNVPQFDGSD
ncbi:hypothetical protein B0H66DRAFT_531172 [Apodospora peruviana]|uniref:Uncharacterized protein n=1 Tax=Apodospora peruviana TaxID=516989 RepID=A0AAE0IBD7_9PEZI|nr:hypothetical protein B0H66DRAFT_531172 [Apodospora peruviana]